MAPVVLEMRRHSEIETIVCVTGQHRAMLDEALNVFALQPDYDLNIMQPGQTLAETTTAVLRKLTPLIHELHPQRLLVQGDTTTTLAASIAAFYEGVPIGHVEAGMRTGSLRAPWPEEFNRRVVDMVADLLWAPTEGAAEALRREGLSHANIIVTGNTVVDALALGKTRLENEAGLRQQVWDRLPHLDAARKMILVTGHRRENFGRGLAEMCAALNSLAECRDIEVVWPVHPNPQVLPILKDKLRRTANMHVIAPVDYLSFIALMMRAYIIITDSGGIQEEAPTLAKPVLVTREATERPEAVAVGAAKLVGASADRILGAALELLDRPAEYARMARGHNPFGDGHAAQRITETVIARHKVV